MIGADFFARQKKSGKKGEEAFFKKVCFIFTLFLFSLPSPHPQGAEKTELPADKKKAQSTVDDQILKAVAKNEDMVKYLAATFTLRDRDVPHTMKF